MFRLHSRSFVMFSAAIFAIGIAPSYAARFSGSTTRTSSLAISGFTDLPFEPEWTVDFETDGQSVIFHRLEVSFSGRIQLPQHSQVFFDLTIDGDLNNSEFDINPVAGLELWESSSFAGPNLSIAGTYHSFLYSNTFSGEVSRPNLSSDSYQISLKFAEYPTSITLGALSGSKQQATYSTGGGVVNELEPGVQMLSIRLTFPEDLFSAAVSPVSCPCCDCGDFDSDDDTDGRDFLTWQRGFAALPASLSTGDGNGDSAVDGSDLAIWQAHYGKPDEIATISIPEPSALAIAVSFIGLAGMRRVVPR